MSIQVNLLGSTLNKLFGKGSSGGGNNGMYLHVAWANDGKGKDFTKSNRTELGELDQYKLIGLCSTDSEDDDTLSFNSYTWTYLCPCGGGKGSGGNNGGNGGTTPEPVPNTIEPVKNGDCFDNHGDVLLKTDGDILYFINARSYGYDSSGKKWSIYFDCDDMGISIWWDLDLCEGPIFFADIADYNKGFRANFINTKLTNMDSNGSGAWNFDTAPKMTVDNSNTEMFATIEGNSATFNSIATTFFPPKQSYHITAVRDWESGGNGYFPEFNLYDITWDYRWKANSYEELVAMLPTMATVTYKDFVLHYDILHDGNPRSGNSLRIPNTYGPNGRKQMCKVYGDRNNTTADLAGTYVGSYMIDSRDNSKNLTTVRFRFFNNYSESDLPACVF